MANIENALIDFKHLDDLADRDTMIHRLHPSVKLLITLVFIIIVASFPKYDLIPLFPMVLYPVVFISLAELPVGFLIKRLLVAVPFVLFIGLFNPIFDQTPLLQIGPVLFTCGWLSLAVIMLKFVLTVLAALILIATSGLNEIGATLLKLKIPKPFVIQLLFLYRYLNVLFEETARTLRAYSLRSLGEKGIRFKAWGSLIGQLLLRTIDRAQRIYHAMLCRGFTGDIRLNRLKRISLKDLWYFIGWTGFFIGIRIYNVPQILGSLVMGVGR